MKTIYFLPGYGENMDTKGYPRIIRIMESAGFKVIPIKINWKHKVMSDYVKQFEEQYGSTHNRGNEVYILGFSFGAMVAFIAAATFAEPHALFLCSLSPYFKEDLNHIEKSWKKDIGKKRVADFEKLSFNNLADQITCKTYLLAGTKETDKYPDLKRRIEEANQKVNLREARPRGIFRQSPQV